jgi:hypothetical protein
MSQYQYVKSANLQTLEAEIKASSIITALDTIASLGTTLTITFKATLSAQDETTLDTLVDTHVNNPTIDNQFAVTLDQPKDSDDAILVRPKAAKTGWTYHLTAPEFCTSKVNSLYHKDVTGSDLNYCIVKYYDAAGTELTTQGSCDTDCVKTVFSFEPTWDYEIIGGTIKTIGSVTEDVRIWVIAVPDIPAANGGSKVMVQSVNLKFIDPNNGIEADGRASKYMTYNSTYHTNKLQLTVKHPAGHQEGIMMALELYKA